MSWLTDNAVKRIFNAFKRSKDKIYKEDIEALNLLKNELISNQKKYVNDNVLYAKLLCCVLRNNLHNYGNMKTAISKCRDILDVPLSHHIEFLRGTINEIDDREYLTSLGINLENYTDSQDEEINKIITENQKEMLEKFCKFWTYEKVEKSFFNTANEFLKDINNYK